MTDGVRVRGQLHDQHGRRARCDRRMVAVHCVADDARCGVTVVVRLLAFNGGRYDVASVRVTSEVPRSCSVEYRRGAVVVGLP